MSQRALYPQPPCFCPPPNMWKGPPQQNSLSRRLETECQICYFVDIFRIKISLRIEAQDGKKYKDVQRDKVWRTRKASRNWFNVVVLPKCWNAFVWMETDQALRGAPHIHLRFVFVSTEGGSDYITAFCVAVTPPLRRRRAHWRGFSTPPLLCHRQKMPNLQWRLSSGLNEFQITGVLFWGVGRERRHSRLPPSLAPPSSSSALLSSNVSLHLHRQMKANEAPAECSTAKFISSVDWVQGGIISWLPGTIGNADKSGPTLKSSL